MKLISISYCQHENEAREWRLAGVVLESINLVVGRNATGKSRMLDSIAFLAKLVRGEVKKFFPVHLSADFEHQGARIKYEISCSDNGVTKEEYNRDADVLLSRGEGGKGRIKAEALQSPMDFQTPIGDVAAFARRDSVQHSFLEPLTDWAAALRHYHFGGTLGKTMYAIMVKSPVSDFDTSDENVTSALFGLGEKKYGENFKNEVINDMKSINYDIENLMLVPPISFSLPPHPLGETLLLAAKEADLRSPIDQHEMSQGMFRALSLLIHVNFALMAAQPSCLLIDDIGEGLDFDRSCSIIELLVKKLGNSPVQLIMSTNDRFVMNKIPIKHWTYLAREGNVTQAYNYANSKAKFDKFKFTGLNNFDFFAADYIHGVVSK